MRNTYFILRHGQTPYQLKKEKVFYPWPEPLPILLTEKGKKQIRKAAEKLKKEKIDLIYSSDVPRTRQTAEIVSEILKGVKIIFDTQLRDIHFGIYQDKPEEEFYCDFSDRKQRFIKAPAGGESWNDVKKRMIEFLKEVDKKHKQKKILIVSHRDPLWLLVGAARGLTNDKLLEEKADHVLEVGEFKRLN